MRSIIVLPGRPAQWVTDHARDLAQRLSDHGAVLVAFMRHPYHEIRLPGQLAPSSVLGHSASGHPLWTGRLGAAVGVVPRHRIAVVVSWSGASLVATLLAVLAARVRGDFVVLDIAQSPPDVAGEFAGCTWLRRAAQRLVHSIVEVPSGDPDTRDERRLLAVCGNDVELARLVLASLDSMGESAADVWRCEIRVDPEVLSQIADHEPRHSGLVDITITDGSTLGPADADVVLAAASADEAMVVRESVATGGAGVLVGAPPTSAIRCHDGVWMTRRDVSALLVAIEASVGRVHRTPVAVLRDVARRIDRLVLEHEMQQRERWAGRPRRQDRQVVS